MIVIMQPGATDDQIALVEEKLKKLGFGVHRSDGEEQTILGAIGTTSKEIDPRVIEILPGVSEAHRVRRPFRLVDRVCRPSGTVVDVAGVRIGGDELVVIAGPCAVESREQINRAADAVHSCGARILRGGAFKPRSSPYAFQGLEETGLKYLREAADAIGIPCVSEVVRASDVELVGKYADMFQVGARNMQNFSLLKALGNSAKPVLLKRGFAATLQELLLAAEYILAAGNPRVVLCERGVRTFEPWTRNTLDLSAVPVLRKQTHLPIIVDPSHATGLREYVTPMARAAIAAGADGVMVEVHDDPDSALCDGAQSLDPEGFSSLMADLKIIAPSVRKRLSDPARNVRPKLAKTIFSKAAIIGIGLIGGSLALALKEVGAIKQVVGVDKDELLNSIKVAGVVDQVYSTNEIEQALAGADLVILAMPVGEIGKTLATIGPHLSQGALVSDVGSTKEEICRAAHVLGKAVDFIGGHPMAGSERRGVNFSDPTLFHDAVWVICPNENVSEPQVNRFIQVIESIGAQPLKIDSKRHDQLVATVSHVPHLIAAALSNMVGRLGEEDELAPRLAAGGFRDVTRTASSSYGIWRDTLITNRELIELSLNDFRAALDRIESALGAEESLKEELTEAARYRLGIPRDLPGLFRPEYELIVRIIDEPGALAAVTTALARENINIRDIQVLKVRQDEDGVLRLAFNNEVETNRAAQVLRHSGHDVRLRSDNTE
ncbi:MAG: 3-deoxy-7-phosphoheptulonate synthase [Deltaproteobacteria bacterium]|nr:3-deoxy-7-phosphoheptulonate synthase [Deltaproteobacteria bacterium]